MGLHTTCYRLKIIKYQLLAYTRQHQLINHNDQRGFLSRHSTCTQLLETTNDWLITLHHQPRR